MDISKCANTECPLKEGCFRFTKKDNYWQSYNMFAPKEGKCEYFITNKEKDNGKHQAVRTKN